MVAYIEADRSVFALNGRSDVRHGESGASLMGPAGRALTSTATTAAAARGAGPCSTTSRSAMFDNVEGEKRDYWLDEFFCPGTRAVCVRAAIEVSRS